jgi:hypothetical protein
MYTCYEVLDFLSTRFFDHHHPKSTTCALPRRKGSIVPASARLGDWKWIAERRIDPLQGWGVEEDPGFHPSRSTFPMAWHWIRIAEE